MEETAYAKLNLALHVRAREPDGYHRIETIFAFAEDGDRLSVAEGEGMSLDVTGPFALRVSAVRRVADAGWRGFLTVHRAARVDLELVD